LTVLGLNSGTSADGLDLAALTIERRPTGVRVVYRAGRTRKYPPALRRRILTCADSPEYPLADSIYLDNLLGEFYGREAAAFIQKLKRRGIRVDVVASHGQTVRHLPKKVAVGNTRQRGTLQLGSIDMIAAATGVVTVGDFRQADIAVGNEGAPVTVAATGRLFADARSPRLIVNVGGMSNYFFFPATRGQGSIAAADCGPGNSLCDLLCDRLFGETFDKGGRHAAAGTVSQRLLTLLLAEPFFKDKTRSTGREAFGPKLADRIIAFGDEFGLESEDLLATAAELTVRSIAAAVAPILAATPMIDKMYLTGGGAHNRFLCKRLAEVCRLPIGSVAELGFDPDLVEAMAFAVMVEACLRSEALPTRFDHTPPSRKRETLTAVLGRIAQPPQRARE